MQSFKRVKNRKLGLKLGLIFFPVLASQSSTFFSANKNAESHDARVLSACDADFEARFFNAIRWLQMSGKVPATRRKRSNRRTRAEARRWRRPFSTFSDCKRRLRLRVRHPHGVTRRTSDVDLKARIFKARRLLQMLDDVSQLTRVALLAVHAPSRSRQAA